ncbi:unnamed protein product [Rotaria sordida]|uniref:G-protein coupled receptors family 1 profile domain-containing protein n=1 Tax=Rotaria sordida TaxID=392033 RepID=A0A813Z3Z3_9BILA|nr:unnamed protein product [Rotaria sordida]CAF0946889.1 unnamed protein product [Rotaria sordida]CAF0966775.1 unnamed protein product [Rotaria sordida]CAF1017225.1 unnamed protein product [Rotaria sordida]CAF1017807.1 unnamed protein product [Rotaria sordida]
MWYQRTTEIIDWICIIMFILGTLGNTLGLIVFSSRKFRRTTYGRLAIASLIINLLCVIRYSLLLHSNARRWLTYKVGQSWFNCKLHRLSSCLRVLSALIIVAWTYERFTYVTVNYRFFTNRPFVKRYKFYFMGFISLIIVGILTGPTVYFYQPRLIILSNHQFIFQQNLTSTTSYRLLNSSYREEYSLKNEDSTISHSYRSICTLKESISTSWNSFLNDVRFGFNYTTLRSILSEIIPSFFVILFDIGIIIHVVLSTSSISSNGSSINTRSSYRGSFQSKDAVHGLIVHNRPRTSWMNIVLIMHSFLFCFSSLTATIVYWSTSNVLLSYSTSVVILSNCSLNFYVYCLSGRSFRNEIRKLFYRYFQLYCFGRFMNLFRTKSQRDEIAQIVRMRLVRHRSTIIPAYSAGRKVSFSPTCN